MKQYGNTGSGPDHLDNPTDDPNANASLAVHPEQLVSKDFIEAWLRKANMLPVDSVPRAATVR